MFCKLLQSTLIAKNVLSWINFSIMSRNFGTISGKCWRRVAECENMSVIRYKNPGNSPNFNRTSEVRKMKEKMRKCYVTEKMESQQKKVSLQSKFFKDVWSEKMEIQQKKVCRNFCRIFVDEVGRKTSSNFAGIFPEFADFFPGICWNSKSRRIPTHPEVSGTHPEVSGIATSSAEICMRPVDPLSLF